MTEIRPATSDDFLRLNGEVPVRTARALSVVRGEDVIGIAGVYRDGWSLVAFSDFTDELRADKRSIVRLKRAFMPLLDGHEVFAHADPEIEGSDVLLENLGFVPFDGRIYQWQP